MRRKNKIILSGSILLLGELLLSGCEKIITEQQDIKPKIEERKIIDKTELSGDAKVITEALQKKEELAKKNKFNQKNDAEVLGDKTTKENNLKNNKTNDMNDNQKIANENINMDFAKTCEQATLKTSMGDIIIKFYGGKAPVTVANFCTLADKGFYDGIKFHRVIDGFMIQTGDPNSKDNSKKDIWGMGDPGYKFQDELPQAGEYKLGSVAMANSGPNTNGSQFFIVSGESGVSLPPAYSLFGEILGGMDVVEKIQKVKTEEKDRPVSPITIKKVVLKLKK